MRTVKRPIPSYPKEARPHHAFVRWQKNERHHRLGRYCEDGGCPLCSSWKAVHEARGELQDDRDKKLINVGRQSGEATAMKALSELAWSAPKEAQPETTEEEAVFAQAQRQGFWRTIRRELRDDGNYSDQVTVDPLIVHEVPGSPNAIRKAIGLEPIDVPPAMPRKPDGEIDYDAIPDATHLFAAAADDRDQIVDLGKQLRQERVARGRLWLFASHWVCSGHLDSSPQDIPCDDAYCNDAREAMG